MNEQRNATSATCNRQSGGEAVNAQTQIGRRTRGKYHNQHLGFLGRATSRLLLLALACIATLAGAFPRPKPMTELVFEKTSRHKPSYTTTMVTGLRSRSFMALGRPTLGVRLRP